MQANVSVGPDGRGELGEILSLPPSVSTSGPSPPPPASPLLAVSAGPDGRAKLEIPSLSTYSEVCVPGCCMILFSNLFCVLLNGVLSSRINLSLCMKFTVIRVRAFLLFLLSFCRVVSKMSISVHKI